jgi:hypothetical protein
VNPLRKRADGPGFCRGRKMPDQPPARKITYKTAGQKRVSEKSAKISADLQAFLAPFRPQRGDISVFCL